MSTFGKVLVVLNMLLVLGWIFLMAAVADMNANWGKKVNELRAQTEKTESEIPPQIEKIQQGRTEATLLQVEAERARVSFRSELARLQRAETETKEARSRFELQQKAAEDADQSSKERAAFRLRERRETQKELEKAEAEVRELIAENNDLRKELKGLQDSFLQTVEENKALVQKSRKGGSASETKVKSAGLGR